VEGEDKKTLEIIVRGGVKKTLKPPCDEKKLLYQKRGVEGNIMPRGGVGDLKSSPLKNTKKKKHFAKSSGAG